MLKRCDNKVIMIYKKYQNKYELPDRELEIYSVDSFTFLESTNIGRCPSAHINRVPRAVYTDTDPAPSVQLIIITLTLMIQFAKKNFDDPGAPHEPHQPWSTHSRWEDQATYQQGESSTSTEWGTFPTQELDNTGQDF